MPAITCWAACSSMSMKPTWVFCRAKASTMAGTDAAGAAGHQRHLARKGRIDRRSRCHVGPPLRDHCRPVPDHTFGRRQGVGVQAAHAAHFLPLVRRHRLHRQPRRAHQRHVGELGVGLGGRQRHGLGHVGQRAHVDALPDAGVVGGIGVRQRAHLYDADHLLLVARVVEEAAVAQLHRLHVVAGDEVAHAGPRLALLAARLLHLPGMLVGLRLEQPVGRPGLDREMRLRQSWTASSPSWAQGALLGLSHRHQVSSCNRTPSQHCTR